MAIEARAASQMEGERRQASAAASDELVAGAAGVRAGRGTYRYACGDVYEGEWKADTQEGRGTIRFTSGKVDVSRYRAGNGVGEGARWSTDGETAWRLRDGVVVEEIPLDEALSIAEAVGEA